MVADWCSRQDAFAAQEVLGGLGVAAARVVPLYELYSRPDPNFLASGFVRRVDHPEAGPTWLPGRPWKLSAAPAAELRGAPCIGQHSREVFAAELGIGDAEYAALVEAGITGTLDDLATAT
jgi:benzylsuccinate CoA-transferase BbsF subunit